MICELPPAKVMDYLASIRMDETVSQEEYFIVRDKMFAQGRAATVRAAEIALEECSKGWMPIDAARMRKHGKEQ